MHIGSYPLTATNAKTIIMEPIATFVSERTEKSNFYYFYLQIVMPMLHAVALEYAILTVRVIVIHIIQEIIANIVLKITMETRVPPVRLIIFPYSPLFNVLCRL